MMTATALGFYTSAVLEAAERSLELGTPIADGVTQGVTIDVGALVTDQLGSEDAASYGY
jgi:uncharacterized membrane protein (DUF485 family)